MRSPHAAYDERDILAAKPERVGEGRVKCVCTRVVRHVIQVTLRIGSLEVDRGGEYLVAERKCDGDEFERTSRGDGMTRHGLGRAYRDRVRRIPERLVQGQGFRPIVLDR